MPASHHSNSNSIIALAVCIAGAAAGPTCGQSAPPIDWTIQFGSTEDDTPGDIIWTSTGSLIVAGSTRGAMGGPSSGGWDVFLTRHSWRGILMWSRQFGSVGDDLGLAACGDGGDGAYIAGSTTGDILAGGHIGGSDAFVARCDPDGNLVWLRQFGTAEDDVARALVEDGAGGFYIAGETWGSLAGPNTGESDAFLARYDAGGNQLWIRQFGDGAAEAIRAMARDSSGTVYIAGNITAAAGSSIFLARFDESGEQIWRRDFGSGGSDRVNTLRIGGYFNGVIIGGGTTGNLGGPNLGSSDAWLAHYTSSGARSWIRQFGTAEFDEITGSHFTIAAGRTEGDLAGTNTGGGDAFILEFDTSSGTPYWMRQLGTSLDDGVVAMVGAITAGYTDGALGGSSSGSRDIFLASIRMHCYPNCDGANPPPLLNVDDFTCFANEFALASMLPSHLQISNYANCDGSTRIPVLNVDDFTCFVNEFAMGCW